MSRGFVREGDQEEAPFIPARAALPAGVTNYVTPEGYRELEAERAELEKQLTGLGMEDERERRRARTVIDGKLGLLNERIGSARILHPEDQPQDEVRFGAKVKLLEQQKKLRQQFQIVGVDEADVKKQKIAFIAPIARAVNGKKIGEIAELQLGGDLRKFEVIGISY